MNSQKYYVIDSTEDGYDVSEMTEEELLKNLDDEIQDASDDPGCEVTASLKKFPKDGDIPVYSRLIIKGEIIVPQPVEVVKKFRLP